MRMVRGALSLGMLLLGCTPSLPDPKILSVSPSTILASDAVEVTVNVSAVLPTRADYGADSLEVSTALTLKVGPVRLGSGNYENHGALEGVLPSVLVPGSYDVSLTLADGRAATLLSGFSVKPGEWPKGYAFDEIPEQQTNRPFGVTLRAVGPHGQKFHGNVSLGGNGVTVSPVLTGAFVDGVRVEMVTLSGATHGEEVSLTASDEEGNSGVSNTFTLKP